MRTIKFRGKNTNEWVNGDLVQCMSDDIKIVNSNRPKEISYRIIDIQSETVGQFTGLVDKNGKEIYEGDIVVSNKVLKGVIIWSCNNASFQIEWRHTKSVYGVFNASIIKDFEIRVIGNIYDNPELLKNNN